MVLIDKLNNMSIKELRDILIQLDIDEKEIIKNVLIEILYSEEKLDQNEITMKTHEIITKITKKDVDENKIKEEFVQKNNKNQADKRVLRNISPTSDKRKC